MFFGIQFIQDCCTAWKSRALTGRWFYLKHQSPSIALIAWQIWTYKHATIIFISSYLINKNKKLESDILGLNPTFKIMKSTSRRRLVTFYAVSPPAWMLLSLTNNQKKSANTTKIFFFLITWITGSEHSQYCSGLANCNELHSRWYKIL